MTIKNKFITAITVILGAIIFSGITQHPVNAAMDQGEIYRKTLINGLQTCYDATYMKSEVDNISNGLEGILTDRGKGDFQHSAGSGDKRAIELPNKIGNTLSGTPALSCYSLFEGIDWDGGHADGLFDIYNKTFDAVGMGYIHDSSSTNNEKCLSVGYNYVINNQTVNEETNEICFNVNESGTVLDAHTEDGTGNIFEIFYDYYSHNFSIYIGPPSSQYNPYTPNSSIISLSSDEYEDIKESLANELANKRFTLAHTLGERGLDITTNTKLTETPKSTSTMDKWFKGMPGPLEDYDETLRKNVAARKAANYLTGRDLSEFAWRDYAFTEQENLDMLVFYVDNALNDNSNFGVDTSKCYSDRSELGEAYGTIVNGQWCELTGWSTAGSDKYNIVDTSTYQSLRSATLEEVLQALKNIDMSKVNTKGSGSTVITDPDSGEEQSEETDPCIENAASLGWIICPLMNKIAEALDGLYDQIIEPFLIVNPSLLSPEGGTWEAWSIMVNIANILTGIFLLVVIFSQLTGVGIDNYNIKKSLPKIITAALLINLSFLICQLAVDLSNILGNSLNKVLTDIGTGISIKLPDGVSAETGDQASWFKGLLTLGAGGVVGIGAISIVQEVFFGGGLVSGLILPALLLFVTAIISIIFFFIILGVRKAGVVIFVVLSPLAFVCYMLPNTKKYFDKWLDGFKALLLVYPICGLLLGGSYLASRILLQTSTDYIMYFAGSMMLVVPYFFIPSLLKGSLRAMGDLGAKLSSFGKTLGSKSSNRLGNTVKNSRGYQERVKQNQENAALRRANRIKKRLGSKNYDELSKRQQRSLYNAQSALIADKDIEKRAKNMSTTGYDAALEAIKKKADAEDVANHMVLINSATKNGADETELMNMFNKYMESGDTSGAVAAARIAGRRKDTASRFMNDTIMNAEKSKKYDSTALAKVAKEISEGENSKNYRAATPLGFEYASQLNSGTAKNAAGSAATGYADWLSNQDNITNAMNHHVTDSGELVGVQGGNLRELADLMEAGHISDTEKNRIQSLARDTIANRDKGPWDTTKADEIYRLAYGENYLQQMAADGVPSKNSVPSQPSNPSPALRGSSTFAMQGVSGEETFTQTADGRVFDSQGRAIEDPGLVIRHHQDQRKREMYQNMTEAQLRSRAENAKASEAVRQGANDELRRRGFS